MLDLATKFSNTFAQDLGILNSIFDVHNIGFLRIFYNNDYFYSCSNSQLMLEYYKHVKDTTIFFQKTINNSQKKHCILWPNISNHYSMDLYLKYNYWNGITLLEKHKNFIDLWWVTSNTSHTRCNCEAYIELFIKYVSYLKLKNFDNLNSIGKKDLYTLINGVDFQNLDKMESNNRETWKKLSFREQECFELINQGYSIKQIANKIGVSFTSVNTYISRLKQKVDLRYKSDLIDLYNKKEP